jgi:hypothetical protein
MLCIGSIDGNVIIKKSLPSEQAKQNMIKL